MIRHVEIAATIAHCGGSGSHFTTLVVSFARNHT